MVRRHVLLFRTGNSRNACGKTSVLPAGQLSDLSEKEDKEGQADVPIAIMPRTGEITLLQADGNLTEEEFEEALDLAMEGCMKISELQHEALKNRYSSE